jgi:hypothetical protein
VAGNIFISYRRDDDPGFTQAIYLRLEQEFPGESLFMDVEGHIKAGDDYVAVLTEWVARCDVLLAIIGARWIDIKDEDGNRRLEKESDFVRVEIASALRLGKRVIPVLVNLAEMPRAGDLPPPLQPLVRRNAVAIRPTRFKADSQGLINALKEALPLAEAERAAKSQAEREAAEAERKRREAEEEARAVQVEAAARQRALAGLTPEEIRKAEELANWDFIKERARPEEFRDHLARFAGGTTNRYARGKLEALLWADPATRASIEALRKFLGEFPVGEHAVEAKAVLDAKKKAVEEMQAAELLHVYGHSNFFYWWVVWAYGFVCALLTHFDGRTVELIPGKHLYVHSHASVGVSFVALMLIVTFQTYYRLKGSVSFIAILVIALAAFITYNLGWWEIIVRIFPQLLIYMNLAFYMALSTVLLALWLLATFVLDSLTYWEFTPGQVTRRQLWGAGAESYDAHGIHIDFVDDDILINKVLGLRFLGYGTADLVFTTAAAGGVRERFTIKNVWRANWRDDQIRELAVVRPRASLY